MTPHGPDDDWEDLDFPAHKADDDSSGLDALSGYAEEHASDDHGLDAIADYPSHSEENVVEDGFAAFDENSSADTEDDGPPIPVVQAINVICHEDGTTGWPATMDRLFGSLGMIGGRRLGVN